MKRIFYAFLASISLLFALPALADSFPSFDQTISISADGWLTVEEAVTVEFDSPRHGIYREIPVKYRTPSGNPFSVRVNVYSVMDGNGVPVPYSLSRSQNDLVVKIGDPDKTVIGRRKYVVLYSAERALLFAESQDQLYWNVITEPWENMGIPEKSSVKIVLPPGIAAGDIGTRCFTVSGSSSDGDCSKTVSESEAEFSARNAPLTVVVGWPKGHVSPPTREDRLRSWLADNGIVFLPLLAFIGMFYLWYKKGRDPKVTGSIAVQYDPPEGASPAELGALVNSAVRKEEITATIIDLAVRGYLEIIEKNEESFIGRKAAYSFKMLKPADGSLRPHEERVMDGIFGSASGAGAEVSMTELQHKFYQPAEEAKGLVFDAAVRRGWFSKSPKLVRGIYIALAAAYAAGAFVIWLFLAGSGSVAVGPVWVASLAIPAAIIAVFGYFMPSRTLKGTSAFAHALGFREYLSKAEKYRLKWEEKENIFEKYLPYAMAFGVVDKWARAFEGALNEPPSWYRGTGYAHWTPMLFASSLNDAASSFAGSMYSAPSSGGGGGFGGGGFGGGGFGGGGGGSW
jgi:uncharacterized membrane protein YgcG